LPDLTQNISDTVALAPALAHNQRGCNWVSRYSVVTPLLTTLLMNV